MDLIQSDLVGGSRPASLSQRSLLPASRVCPSPRRPMGPGAAGRRGSPQGPGSGVQVAHLRACAGILQVRSLASVGGRTAVRPLVPGVTRQGWWRRSAGALWGPSREAHAEAALPPDFQEEESGDSPGAPAPWGGVLLLRAQSLSEVESLRDGSCCSRCGWEPGTSRRSAGLPARGPGVAPFPAGSVSCCWTRPSQR